MIRFHYELDFQLKGEGDYESWIRRVLESESFSLGEIQYIFCNDQYLLNLHEKYLKMDSFTDIITFDYSEGISISGDIFISVERVRDNARSFANEFEEELQRVMVHGVLHMMGYNDKDNSEELLMRTKEDEKIKMFHVEQ